VDEEMSYREYWIVKKGRLPPMAFITFFSWFNPETNEFESNLTRSFNIDLLEGLEIVQSCARNWKIDAELGLKERVEKALKRHLC
jgi:hypothetical protein